MVRIEVIQSFCRQIHGNLENLAQLRRLLALQSGPRCALRSGGSPVLFTENPGSAAATHRAAARAARSVRPQRCTTPSCVCASPVMPSGLAVRLTVPMSSRLRCSCCSVWSWCPLEKGDVDGGAISEISATSRINFVPAVFFIKFDGEPLCK